MPAATTHVEFAKDVLTILPEDIRTSIRNMPMYYLGSQGPDFLFFSRLSVLPGSLKHYGNCMHQSYTREIMHYFDEHAADDNDLYSYFCGYLCHYALDSTAHPLVNAFAKSEHNKTGRPSGEIHVRIEAEFDLWKLAEEGRTKEDYDVYEYMNTTKEDRAKLARLYHGMFREVMNEDVKESDIAASARSTYSLTKFLKPDHHAKYSILRYAESILNMGHGITDMMLFDKQKSIALNTNHSEWRALKEPDIPRTESFPDLYQRAMKKASALLQGHTDADFAYNFNGEPLPEE